MRRQKSDFAVEIIMSLHNKWVSLILIHNLGGSNLTCLTALTTTKALATRALHSKKDKKRRLVDIQFVNLVLH